MAWGIEAGSFLEGVAALVALGRFHGKAHRVGGLGNMMEMIERVFFSNAKPF